MGPFCVVINCLIKGSKQSEQINKPYLFRAYQRRKKKFAVAPNQFCIWKTNRLKCYYCSLETCCCHSQAAPLSGGAHALQWRRRCEPPASHSASVSDREEERWVWCEDKQMSRQERWRRRESGGLWVRDRRRVRREEGKKEGEGIICLYCVSAQSLKRNNLHQ